MITERRNAAAAGSEGAGDEIKEVKARQVLDSRGNPTVEVDVWTRSGAFGRASVPSGASTGIHEALELRDRGKEFGGLGVSKAVSNVNERIRHEIIGMSVLRQRDIDMLMVEMDGTPNKRRLGANAILGVSMAVARAAASYTKQSLYAYLETQQSKELPLPMMNIINGGKHAGNNLAIQEFLVEPVSASGYSEALRMGVEIYHTLKNVLKDKYGPSAINVGDEGGYAPPISKTEEALDCIMTAIIKTGYSESDIKLGIDAAASNFYASNMYQLDGKSLSSSKLEEFYSRLADIYPIKTIEDPFDEESFEDFASITKRLGSRIKIIGDDIYVTNVGRIKKGIDEKSSNASLIKLNQIGTVTETLQAVRLTKEAGWMVVVSHRSGETDDPFIAHFAVAVGSTFIKTGAPARGERVSKYNELLRIEEEMGNTARIAKIPV
ncbi:MAG: phosphopyruvate hydratase [Conexivisphaerales archaeon]